MTLWCLSFYNVRHTRSSDVLDIFLRLFSVGLARYPPTRGNWEFTFMSQMPPAAGPTATACHHKVSQDDLCILLIEVTNIAIGYMSNIMSNGEIKGLSRFEFCCLLHPECRLFV